MTRWARGIEFPGLLAASLFLAMLVLVACHSEGAAEPRESNLTLTQVNSLVALGSGVSLQPETLTARTSAGTSRVSPEGRVSTMIFEEGPQYAELLDNRGRTVMLAFASPDEPDFSALSTAKALGYLALSGPWLLGDGRLKLLDEIDTAPGFLPVLNAVESQLASQGYLDLEGANLQSAIVAMAAAIHDPAPASGQHVRPLGVIAEPTSASGLSLDTTVDGKLNVENVFLRRVSLLFRRLSYVPAVPVGPPAPGLDPPPAEVIENNAFTRIDMDNVERYAGVVGTLEAFLEGKVAYSPVRIDPALDIPIYPADAKSTTYQIYAIGPAFSFRPGLVIPADVLAAQEVLEMKAFFMDVFVVLMANVVLPLKGDQIDEYLDFIGGNAILGDFIATMKGTVPDVWAKMQEGQWGEAAKTLARSTVTSNTILPLLGQLSLEFLWKAGITREDHEKLFSSMKVMLDTMGKVDIGLNALDTGLLATDMARSKKVEQFLVKTTPGKVTLVAGATQIDATATTTIDAVIQDKDPAGTYEYQWSVSPSGNYWVEDFHLNGTDDAPNGILVTAESRVNIRGLLTTEGVAVVSCRAFRTDGVRREVGDNTVSITFTRALRVEQNLDNFKSIATVFQQTNGKWTAVTGTYIDLPRSALALQYGIGRQREGTIATWGVFVDEPPAKVEFFEFSDDRPSAGSISVVGGQVPGGYIRWWANVLEWSDKNTSAAAQATADSFKASELNYAKLRPVSFITNYRP